MAYKVGRISLLSDFHENILALMLIFCQENVHFLKSTHSSCLFFVKKTVHSRKNNVLSCYFFSNFYEKPPAVTTIFGPKKHQFCQTYTILLAKKVNSKPFFSQFTKKSFLSRHMTKMSILYKSTCSHAHFW